MKLVLSNRKPIDVYSEASNILCSSVEHTLGPKGTNTAIQVNNMFNIINDGKSIIEKLTSEDKEVAVAMESLKQASFETDKKASDGPQPLYAKVLTPKGFKEMKDLKIGDIICGTDCTKQKVLGIFPKGKKQIYEVRFSDGSIVECSDNHLWSVYSYTNNKFETLTVLQMLKKGIYLKKRKL